MKRFSKKVGDSHPDTLRTMNNFANTHDDHGKFIDAEVLFKQCLDKQKVVLGETHPHTLSTMNNLAATTSKIQAQNVVGSKWMSYMSMSIGFVYLSKSTTTALSLSSY